MLSRILLRPGVTLTLLRRGMGGHTADAGGRTPQELADYAKKGMEKGWGSLGFHWRDPKRDQVYSHIFFFAMCTFVTYGIFWFSHVGDIKNQDWAQREAFLAIREREAAGLPHVDMNLVDPAKFKLPSETELGDTEIII